MGVADSVKQSFIAGLILLAPLVVTVFVLRVLVGWALTVVNPVVQRAQLIQYTANIELVAQAVAAVLIVGSIVAIGYAARWTVGRRVFGRVGRVVNLIPLVNVIYASARQVATALVDRDTAYERAVLLELPREGHFALGFVTGESPSVVEPVTGEPAVNVFLPNSPNPTAGRLFVVPESRVHEIDLSVRRALQLVVTTGMAGDRAPRLPRVAEED